MKKLNALAGAAALALGAGAAGAAETWDMPMAYPDSNFHTENGKAFAACVGERSNGELEIVVHGGGSLFKGDEIKRAVQTGQALIGERLLSAHANENPLFGVDSIPFLATSYEASDKLWQASRPALEELLASQNMVLLYAVPWPPQGLYTKKELNAASDMEGVKFRSYNAATARMAELMGAVPVQIEAAELSQALATGVAESFISSGSTGYDSKVWEQLTHWYEVNAWLPRNHVLVNQQAWEGLDDATRTALSECAAEAEAQGTAKSEELNDWYKEQLAANGMTVTPPGDQLRADLEAIGAQMTEEWLASAGESGQAVIEAYRGM
ncbi:MAG: TRAP transporter substrate-binding protein [Geminicoccaceae bacterium]|jgi:TRAP-type C4-dicarboxylate transport system substrate-binding protein|nr:TRAP transporter substrate-binding protein [Geminicoccaceae bacterium]HRY24852.1 TRAP transporter substrate-binding protein [Geminicoccaceae bacterium]